MSEEKKEEPEKTVQLEWRDYVAVVIASFETTLMPFLILIVVLLLLWFAIKR